MTDKKTHIYEPALGLDGTIVQLVDWANRYTEDYTDEALKRISEIAKQSKMEKEYVQIPLLLIDERKRASEAEDGVGTPYERMKIDQFLFGNVSYSESNYGGVSGTELEIYSEKDSNGGHVLVSFTGIDDAGTWRAASACGLQEFMDGDYDFLDRFIGQVLYYSKTYDTDGEDQLPPEWVETDDDCCQIRRRTGNAAYEFYEVRGNDEAGFKVAYGCVNLDEIKGFKGEEYANRVISFYYKDRAEFERLNPDEEGRRALLAEMFFESDDDLLGDEVFTTFEEAKQDIIRRISA